VSERANYQNVIFPASWKILGSYTVDVARKFVVGRKKLAA
jgi:hypothetical protein